MTKSSLDVLRERAQALRLWGVIAHWEKVAQEPWLRKLIEYEEQERGRRGLERRTRTARLGRLKPLPEFDWSWPRKVDREQIEGLFSLEFVKEAANVILVGPSGTGKTFIAKALAHQAVVAGYSARFITASELLNDLASQPVGSALTRRISRYCRPQVLVIDELGYLASTGNRADLLFELVNRRYQEKPIVLTTNKAFSEWADVFPENSACAVALIDRLVHKAEIISIDADSYRQKEAKERALTRKKAKEKKR